MSRRESLRLRCRGMSRMTGLTRGEHVTLPSPHVSSVSDDDQGPDIYIEMLGDRYILAPGLHTRINGDTRTLILARQCQDWFQCVLLRICPTTYLLSYPHTSHQGQCSHPELGIAAAIIIIMDIIETITP